MDMIYKTPVGVSTTLRYIKLSPDEDGALSLKDIKKDLIRKNLTKGIDDSIKAASDEIKSRIRTKKML